MKTTLSSMSLLLALLVVGPPTTNAQLMRQSQIPSTTEGAVSDTMYDSPESVAPGTSISAPAYRVSDPGIASGSGCAGDCDCGGGHPGYDGGGCGSCDGGGGWGGGYTDACSMPTCGGCGACDDCCAACCDPVRGHHLLFGFGDALYWRPRNMEIAYASAINGPITAPPVAGIEVAPIGVIDHEYEPGFRAGFGFGFDDCSSITVAYTFWESADTIDFVQTSAPDVLRSLVSHPEILSGAGDFLQAGAFMSTDLDLIDVDYRHRFLVGRNYALQWLAGARYAHFDQLFGASFTLLGTENVATQLRFDGGGPRVGLEGERVGRNGLLIYGKSAASFVLGEFKAGYQLTSSFDPRVVDTAFEGSRLVSMLDLEIGTGWTCRSRKWRMHVGYQVNGWFNMVKTDDFIQAVRNNNWVDLNDAISFDGVVGRIEFRY